MYTKEDFICLLLYMVEDFMYMDKTRIFIHKTDFLTKYYVLVTSYIL